MENNKITTDVDSDNKFDKFLMIGGGALVSMFPTMLALPFAEAKVLPILIGQMVISFVSLGVFLLKENTFEDVIINPNDDKFYQVVNKKSSFKVK